MVLVPKVTFVSKHHMLLITLALLGHIQIYLPGVEGQCTAADAGAYAGEGSSMQTPCPAGHIVGFLTLKIGTLVRELQFTARNVPRATTVSLV